MYQYKRIDEFVKKYLQLYRLLLRVIQDRAERRFRRNSAAAHFPVAINLSAFAYGIVKEITKSQAPQLQDFSWIDKH